MASKLKKSPRQGKSSLIFATSGMVAGLLLLSAGPGAVVGEQKGERQPNGRVIWHFYCGQCHGAPEKPGLLARILELEAPGAQLTREKVAVNGLAGLNFSISLPRKVGHWWGRRAADAGEYRNLARFLRQMANSDPDEMVYMPEFVRRECSLCHHWEENNEGTPGKKRKGGGDRYHLARLMKLLGPARSRPRSWSHPYFSQFPDRRLIKIILRSRKRPIQLKESIPHLPAKLTWREKQILLEYLRK